MYTVSRVLGTDYRKRLLYRLMAQHQTIWPWIKGKNKKLSWCWQTRATRLEVSRVHHTWYHSIS